MKRIMLFAALALIAALAVACQDDRDEPAADSRQPSPQYNTTPEVTHEVTQEVTVERTLPNTGGALGQ